jgi:hypothetical protein
MEGAITTGLEAAKALEQAARLGRPVRIRRPKLPPRWLAAAGAAALLPVAALAKGMVWLGEKRGGESRRRLVAEPAQ